MMDTASIVEQLKDFSDDELLELVGQKAGLANINIELAVTITTDAATSPMGLEDAKKIGRKLVDHFEKELYRLLCSPDKDARKDSEFIWNAFEMGTALEVAHQMAQWLTANFAILPVAAAIIALYVVRRLPERANQAVCAAWSERIK